MLETYLTMRSGVHVAEAIGALATKLLALVLAGLILYGVGMAVEDGGLGAVVAVVLLPPCALAFGWIGLFMFTGVVVDQLSPRGRFRRLPRASHRTRGAAGSDTSQAGGRTSPPRSVILTLLFISVPALLVLAHILSAYLESAATGRSFRWTAWEDMGIGLEPLFYVTNRWPFVVLFIVGASLLSLLILLGIAAVAAGGRALASLRPGASARRERTTRRELPELPSGALIAAPHGQAALLRRAGIFLLAGLPAAALLAYCALAYASQLWRWWSWAPASFVSWSAPATFSPLGEWFFTDDLVALKIAGVTVSSVLLCAGIVLAQLAVPLLLRRGADAIDLALTPSGVLTRGGLEISWHEIAEVLIVRDTRMGSVLAQRPVRMVGQSRAGINLTYLEAHSRIRVALVLRDLPDVAARAALGGPPQHRSLRADSSFNYGYALCDLWVHPHAAVGAALSTMTSAANRRGIPVTEIARTHDFSHLENGPGWYGLLFRWR